MPSGECSGSRRNRFRTRTPLLYNGRMKFSIRDVLWLTVVAALAVGWTIDRVKLRRESSDALLKAAKQAAQAEEAQLVAQIKDDQAARQIAILRELAAKAARANPPPSSTAP